MAHRSNLPCGAVAKATVLCLLFHSRLMAQSDSALYFIHYQFQSAYEFAEFDMTDGSVTSLATLDLTSFSLASACIDGPGERYHLCTGGAIITLDPDGLVPPQTTELPLTSGQNLLSVEYDHCEGVFVGLLNDPPANSSIVRFDPISGEMGTIVTLDGAFPMPMGGQGMFDPETRLYMVRTAETLITVNVDEGTVENEVTLETDLGFTPLHHLAYDCTRKHVLGTWVGPSIHSETGKFLCELDPATGEVTVLSQVPSLNGVMKPGLGGSTINTNDGMFLWSGVTGMVVGSSVITGEMSYVQQMEVGELFLVEHFSSCACASTSDVGSMEPSGDVRLSPNPAVDQVVLSGTRQGQVWSLTDVTGRMLSTGTCSEGRTYIELRGRPDGVYHVVINGGITRRLVIARQG